MEPVPELTDGRVRLRRWREDDRAALYEAVRSSLKHLAPFLPWAVGGYTEADAQEFLSTAVQGWADGARFEYANVGPDGQILGSCGLLARAGEGGLEAGYWIRESWTGRGIVTAAVALLTAEAFRVGAKFVEIRHDPANVRSGLIPQRLGFTRLDVRPADLAGGTMGTGKHQYWRLYPPLAGRGPATRAS